MNLFDLELQKDEGDPDGYHTWYRRLEKTVKITIVSADPDEGHCSGCGAVRTRFQCQIYPERSIIALCKECAIQRAGSAPASQVQRWAVTVDTEARIAPPPKKLLPLISALPERMQSFRLSVEFTLA